MRFVHTADWQLGMTRYFLNGEAQPRYSAARRDVVAETREVRLEQVEDRVAHILVCDEETGCALA